jgi:hypothetical protein
MSHWTVHTHGEKFDPEFMEKLLSIKRKMRMEGERNLGKKRKANENGSNSVRIDIPFGHQVQLVPDVSPLANITCFVPFAS